MKRFAVALFLLTCVSARARAADLLVAAASDLGPMTAALEQSYQKATGAKMRFSLGSSGVLARQIENGAPFDVFLSANDQYVKDLAAHGYVVPDTVAVYALGRVALWSLNGS